MTELLAQELIRRGHGVTVFGQPGGMLETRIRGVAPFEPILGGPDLDPPTLMRVGRALRRLKTEVVLALTRKDLSLTAPVAYASGLPLVYRHANDRRIGSGWYKRLLYGVFTAFHITNAEATRDTVLESAPWIERDRVRVVYNGIDSTVYKKAAPLLLNLPPGSLKVGYVGMFAARKGLRELAVAWPAVAAALPNAHLIMVGQGALETELKAALSERTRVHWLGYRTDVPSVMKSLDVLVLPSHVEGAPNVVQEAMASGTAVVATAVSGTPELVRDGIDAWLVPTRDSALLSGALIEALSNDVERKRRAASASQRVEERFGVRQMIDSYEELLERIATERA